MVIILFLPYYRMQSYNFHYKIYLLIYVLILDIAIPIMAFKILKIFKIISNLQLENAKERTFPYIIMLIVYSFTGFLFFRIPYMPPFIYGLFISISLIVLIISILNNFLKVSAHSAAVSAASVWFYIIFRTLEINTSNLLIISIIISGLVMSSRLYLKVHTQSEIYLGFLVGLLTSLSIGEIFIY